MTLKLFLLTRTIFKDSNYMNGEMNSKLAIGKPNMVFKFFSPKYQGHPTLNELKSGSTFSNPSLSSCSISLSHIFHSHRKACLKRQSLHILMFQNFEFQSFISAMSFKLLLSKEYQSMCIGMRCLYGGIVT